MYEAGSLKPAYEVFPGRRGQIFSIFAKNRIIVHDLKSFNKSASFCFSKKSNINFDFGVSRLISNVIRAYFVILDVLFQAGKHLVTIAKTLRWVFGVGKI